MKWDNLPEGWKVKVLTRAARLNPTEKLPNFWSDQTEVAYIPMENVENGTGRVKEVSIRPLKNVLSGKTRFRHRDVLFAKITPCLEHKKIAFVESIPTEVGFGSTEFYVLRPNESTVVPKYLFYVLQSDNVVAHTVSSMTGTSGRKRVPSHAMRSVAIPLPPLEEQRQIVEILELADELRHKRKAANQLIDKIIRSLFLDMFGDPATNPKEWEVRRLEDVAEIKGGGTPSRKHPEFFTGSIPWAVPTDLSALKSLYLEDPKEHITEEAIHKSSTVLMPAQTVLLSSRATIGLVCIARTPICFNQGITGFKCNETYLAPEYLAICLRRMKEEFQNLAGATTFPEIKRTTLRTLEIPIPPLPLQRRFAELVSQFEEKRGQMGQAAEEVERLYQSLLKKAFSGELTKQWREVHQIRWELPQLTERQKVLLAVLYYYNAIQKAPPPITMLMKYMFLLQQEKGLELEYAFVPYKFGPFSKEVYEDIEALEKEMLVVHTKKSKNIERQETALDEEATDDIEAILAALPEDDKKAVGELIEKYGSMGFRELMDYVYTEYPEFATESKRKGRHA